MGKNHNGMVKGFTHLSKAWYGGTVLKRADYSDSIDFGYCVPDGKTTGSMCVEWVTISGKSVPKLIIYSDSWNALSEFHDLIDLLGKHDGEDPTPEQFCEFLLECGFTDLTETTRK